MMKRLLALLLPLFALPLSACAAQSRPVHIETGGGLPSVGTVTIRSGLAWLNETSPAFAALRPALEAELKAKGLQVVQTMPSTLEPMPRSPLMGETATSSALGSPQRPQSGGDEEAAKARAAELRAAGKLPPVKLEGYAAQALSDDVPDSVKAIRPPDPMTILFAMSQAEGKPLLRRGGPIPGRVVKEMTSQDAAKADYALVVRFTLVRPSYGGSGGGVGRTGGGLATGGGIHGVSTLGYGAPATPAPPAPTYGPAPVDYAKGYEGSSPAADSFGRRYDMMARDYTFKHGPQPEYATPPTTGTPSGAAGGAAGQSGIGSFPAASAPVPGAGVLGLALEMECYDLRVVKNGQAPKRIWKAVVQQRADSPADLPAALPDMAKKAFAKKEK